MALISAGLALQLLDIPSTLTHLSCTIDCCVITLSVEFQTPHRLLSSLPELGANSTTDNRNRKVPTAMADYVEQNNLQSKMKYSLFVGASAGSETENRWAALDMINRRSPHQVGKDIAKGINSGRINFFDKHLSMFPSDLVYVRDRKSTEWKFVDCGPTIRPRFNLPPSYCGSDKTIG